MLEFRLGILKTVLAGNLLEEVHGRKGWHSRRVMRFLAPLICMLGFCALGQTTNLTVKIMNLPNPVVGFRVPDPETNVLTIINKTNLVMASANQQVRALVGCQNMMDVSWLAATNKVYHVLIRTNLADAWTYSRIRIVGTGSAYHFYDFLDAPRRFYALSIE